MAIKRVTPPWFGSYISKNFIAGQAGVPILMNFMVCRP
jgi:hypothetical protein